jgi:hypothetical protein
MSERPYNAPKPCLNQSKALDEIADRNDRESMFYAAEGLSSPASYNDINYLLAQLAAVTQERDGLREALQALYDSASIEHLQKARAALQPAKEGK